MCIRDRLNLLVNLINWINVSNMIFHLLPYVVTIKLSFLEINNIIIIVLNKLYSAFLTLLQFYKVY